MAQMRGLGDYMMQGWLAGRNRADDASARKQQAKQKAIEQLMRQQMAEKEMEYSRGVNKANALGKMQSGDMPTAQFDALRGPLGISDSEGAQAERNTFPDLSRQDFTGPAPKPMTEYQGAMVPIAKQNADTRQQSAKDTADIKRNPPTRPPTYHTTRTISDNKKAPGFDARALKDPSVLSKQNEATAKFAKASRIDKEIKTRQESSFEPVDLTDLEAERDRLIDEGNALKGAATDAIQDISRATNQPYEKLVRPETGQQAEAPADAVSMVRKYITDKDVAGLKKYLDGLSPQNQAAVQKAFPELGSGTQQTKPKKTSLRVAPPPPPMAPRFA